MGIDLATWRARIGLNYYHMCRPLQTRWRSSGGWLCQPGVASWGVGEVMNDTTLVLRGCMTVVALSLILQYAVYSWSKLKGRGGGGKVRCHWRGSTSIVKGILDGGGTLLLRTIVVVTPLLLVIAGDVERNPGPGGIVFGGGGNCMIVTGWMELSESMYKETEKMFLFTCTEPTLKALLNELHSVRANWYNIGLELDIPYTELNCFRKMYSDPSDSLREVLIHWLDTAVDPCRTWEAVVTALRSPLVVKKNIAEQLESKYCAPMQDIMDTSNSPTKAEKCEGTLSFHDLGVTFTSLGYQPSGRFPCRQEPSINKFREHLSYLLHGFFSLISRPPDPLFLALQFVFTIIPHPCIIYTVNENQDVKMGEAWKQG